MGREIKLQGYAPLNVSLAGVLRQKRIDQAANQQAREQDASRAMEEEQLTAREQQAEANRQAQEQLQLKIQEQIAKRGEAAGARNTELAKLKSSERMAELKLLEGGKSERLGSTLDVRREGQADKRAAEKAKAEREEKEAKRKEEADKIDREHDIKVVELKAKLKEAGDKNNYTLATAMRKELATLEHAYERGKETRKRYDMETKHQWDLEELESTQRHKDTIEYQQKADMEAYKAAIAVILAKDLKQHEKIAAIAEAKRLLLGGGE